MFPTKQRQIQNVKRTNRFIVPIHQYLLFVGIILMFLLTGCQPLPPVNYTEEERAPVIWPDYTETVLPFNIAPINFRIEEKADDYRTILYSETGVHKILSGKKVLIPMTFWKNLLNDNRGKNLYFDIYTRQESQWKKWKTITNIISEDSIDPYIAYRLIPPGQYFGEITLNQRHLENFTETPFFDNNGTFNDQPSSNGTCGNCHYFRNGKTDEFLFHVRFIHSGTIMVRNGNVEKIETKFKETGNAATYPAWHPTKPVIVFSANQTLQLIHSRSLKKNETFDTYSDLILYDIEKNKFTQLFQTRNVFETFPCWTPDGKTLYFCSCDTLTPDKVDMFNDNSSYGGVFTIEDFAAFKYNLWRMSFNQETYQFGKPELVVDAARQGKSIAFPRISNNGRFLIYTLADFGTFPIMHHESDLWLYDIQTGENRPMSEINSDKAETYHTWDTSGRWLVFSTRRDDGSYTRLYFTHIDDKGYGSKPFLLPQKDPEDNLRRMKSYNIPEMVSEKIKIPTGKLMRTVQSPKITNAEYQ